MSRSATVHFASSPELDPPVTPKRKPIRRPRAKAPAYETHGPLVLGFAFTIEELQKRALERLPEYRELSQQSPLPLMKMIPKAQRLIYDPSRFAQAVAMRLDNTSNFLAHITRGVGVKQTLENAVR
ncbi:hypothetical protein F5879DRAFT_1020999, partial [Lentinula edodes]